MQSVGQGLLVTVANGSYLDGGWALPMFVHNKDMFLPTFSIAADFAGQRFSFHR